MDHLGGFGKIHKVTCKREAKGSQAQRSDDENKWSDAC